MSLRTRISKLNREKRIKDDKRDLGHALKRIRELERELDAANHIKRGIASYHIQPIHGGDGKSEATAVAIASDWHVGEVVNPKHVSGLNRYSPEIAKERSVTFFQRIVRMVEKERQDVRIDNLILALLGDFITGRIHEENLESCVLRPIEETLYAQQLLVSGIRFLLEHTNLHLIIPCNVGNHSRITQKVHAATEAGNSLESMMYHSIANHFAGEKRATFVVSEGYHTYLQVYNSTFRLHHGHATSYNGGIGGLTIPLVKSIHAWNLTKMASQDLMGHWHSYTPHRRFIVNGSMIGYSAYALRMKAEYEPPQQAFFLWDRDRGKTVTMPIFFS